jgi:hypothetical protein
MFGRILFLQGPYQLGFGADLSWFERSELLCSFEMKHLVVPHISMLEEYWHINYPIIGISNPIILSCDIYWHIGNDDLEEFPNIPQSHPRVLTHHSPTFGRLWNLLSSCQGSGSTMTWSPGVIATSRCLSGLLGWWLICKNHGDFSGKTLFFL